MKIRFYPYLLALLLALASAPRAHALGVTPGLSFPSLTVAGRVFTDLTDNLKVLWAMDNSGAGSKFGTFKNTATGAGYQVTAGKTFRATAARVYVVSPGTANPCPALGYGDTDVGFNSASGPTNPVSLATNLLPGPGSPAGTVIDVPINMKVPATKFLYFQTPAGTTATGVQLFGYEE